MKKYLGQGIAEKLAESKGLSAEDKEVVAYGLEYLLSLIIGVIITLAVALVFEILPETIVIFICWGMIRIFAGGGHCSNLWRCAVSSCVAVIVTVFLSRGIMQITPTTLWIAVVALWVLLATWLWAPNNSEKPVSDPKGRKILRNRALLAEIVVFYFLFYYAGRENYESLVIAGATGMSVAAFMITPFGVKFIKWFDDILINITFSFSKGGEKS